MPIVPGVDNGYLAGGQIHGTVGRGLHEHIALTVHACVLRGLDTYTAGGEVQKEIRFHIDRSLIKSHPSGLSPDGNYLYALFSV